MVGMTKRDRIATWVLTSTAMACGSPTPSFETRYDDTTSRIQSNSDLIIEADSSENTDAIKGAKQAGAIIYIDPVDDLGTLLGDSKIEEKAEASLSQTFTNNSFLEETLSIDLLGLIGETRFSMTSNVSDGYLSEQQTERTAYFDQFGQGSIGSESDTFTQTADNRGIVDIMVVIDNSGSMNEEQQNLADKLDPLLSFVQNSNWRIAVNTTDPRNGCVTQVINNDSPTATADFSAAVTAGTWGSGNEQGVLQAVQGLKAECLATPWVRSNSTVAVLIVSDEDNCSTNGSMCAGQPHASASFLSDYLASIRSVGSNARVYGLISHPDDPCSTAYNEATQYSALISDTGGTFGDICDSDYSNTLGAISQDISSILRDQFALSQVPRAGTLEVLVNGNAQVNGVDYTLVGNIIEFINVPVDGAQITANYDTDLSLEDSFTLSNEASTSGLEVKVNGAVANNYSLESDSKTLKFNSMPAPNAVIAVNYRSNASLKNTFSLSSNAVSSSIKITVDGSPWAKDGYTFDSATGSLLFSNIPPDSSTIVVEYAIETGKVLSYEAIDLEDGFEIVDTASGQPIPYDYDGTHLTFSASDHQIGRMISIVFDLEENQTNEIKLNHSPKENSIQVSWNDGGLCNETNGLLVNGNTLNTDSCNLTGATDFIEVSYQYLNNAAQAYQLDISDFTEYPIQVWQVLVNGVLASDYSVNNGVVMFDAAPTNNSVIEATVYFLNEQ